MAHKIASVDEGSIAWQLGVRAGDELIAINGEYVVDLLDYEALQAESEPAHAGAPRRGSGRLRL